MRIFKTKSIFIRTKVWKFLIKILVLNKEIRKITPMITIVCITILVHVSLKVKMIEAVSLVIATIVITTIIIQSVLIKVKMRLKRILLMIKMGK